MLITVSEVACIVPKTDFMALTKSSFSIYSFIVSFPVFPPPSLISTYCLKVKNKNKIQENREKFIGLDLEVGFGSGLGSMSVNFGCISRTSNRALSSLSNTNKSVDKKVNDSYFYFSEKCYLKNESRFFVLIF